MSEQEKPDAGREAVTLPGIPGKKFYFDSIDFNRTEHAQTLSVKVDHQLGTMTANLRTENTEDLERLVLEYMEKARVIVPDVRLNFAEIVWESDEELSLVLSITLPVGIGIMSDEGFKLQDLAQLISDTSGNRVSVEYSEYRRGNIIPLKIPAEFQSNTFQEHQKLMWAHMALDGMARGAGDRGFEQRLRDKPKHLGAENGSILRQIMWKIDTPKTREYSAIILITIITYVVCLFLCAWIESLKR
ncbi:hypothetical protein KF728_09590 [Candidatus Obscuribacterales bacterium]|nr:hypothetical protein [Candidatus Obscuribacterales bacterium]